MAQEGFKRKLTAILSADAVGYSRLMAEDEAATVKTLATYREVMTTLIKQHRGRVVDSPGDNVLAEFSSVVDAVQCAVAVQNEFQTRNAELAENRRMAFRIGINVGDVIDEEDRIYGDGVNVAARLEALADPGGICVSKTAFDQIETKLPLGYEYLGEQSVKNMPKPVGAYRVLMQPRVTVAKEKEAAEIIPFWRRKGAIAGAIAVLVVIIGVAVWNFHLRPPRIEPASVERMTLELPEKPSIAVLAFKNLSDDPKQEYLSDGISEAIISTLSKVPRMFVIAANSSFTYKGKPVKVQQVAEELGVQYVLEGSVQRSGEKLRVTAQLIDAIKGHHLWSERYDLKMDDLLGVQDQIAMNVVAETQVKLTEGEQALLLRRETNSLRAYEKVMEAGMYLRRNTREDYFKARQLGDEAIRLDPNFSGAYRLVGWCHLYDVWKGWAQDPKRSFRLAGEYAQKALTLDENNSENLALWAFLQKDTEKTVEILRRAVEINPNLANVTIMFGGALFNSGRSEEAIHYVKKAIRLNPFPPARYFEILGLIYCFDGRYEEALVASKKALDMKPDDVTTLRNLTVIYIGLGQEDKARAAATEVLKLDPNFSVGHVAKLWPNLPGGSKRFVDALRKAGLPDGKSSLPLPGKPSIAVLPFVNMSDDPKQEYFSDGITEHIITSLSKVPYLFVIARHSTFSYKGKSATIQQIAEELGVRYVLEGSIQRSDDRVRITVQLIDATTGHHLWAENYDRKLKDIFALQDEIAMKIMAELQVKLTRADMGRFSSIKTTNLKAYEKLLKGTEHLSRRTEGDVLEARRLAQEAIDLDPEYGAAYLLLGWTHLDDIWFNRTKDRAKSLQTAEHLTQKAIKSSGQDATTHRLLGCVFMLRGQYEKAIVEAQKAVELSPNSANSNFVYGMVLGSAERYNEAIPVFKKAIRLNPVTPISYLNNLAWAYMYTEQYEKAIPLWQRAIERNPDYLFAYQGLTVAYQLSGDETKAHEAAAEVLRIKPTFSISMTEIAKRTDFKNKKIRERILEAYRKAGLPEHSSQEVSN